MVANNEAIVRYQKAPDVHTTFAKYGKLQQAKLEHMAEPGNSHAETSWLLKRREKLLDICHEVPWLGTFSDKKRWKCSLHCDYNGTSSFHWAKC